MSATFSGVALRGLGFRILLLPHIIVDARSLLQYTRFKRSRLMESHEQPAGKPSFATSAYSNRGGGRGGRSKPTDSHQASRGSGSSSSGDDKIDALGRLLTRILRHKASELKLDMRNDGYVKVQDLLKLNLKTFANIPLRSYRIEDAVRQDNKQRFGLVEENGELLIRANQGHSIATVATESLLKPILSPEEVTVCLHGTSRGINSTRGSPPHAEITCAFLEWLAYGSRSY